MSICRKYRTGQRVLHLNSQRHGRTEQLLDVDPSDYAKVAWSTYQGPREDLHYSLVWVPVLIQSPCTLSSDIYLLVLQVASRPLCCVPYSPISHLARRGWA
jgi:hypothetical protein